jgi:hypothetical protein
MKGPAIVASVLGADYAKLGHEVAELEAAPRRPSSLSG